MFGRKTGVMGCDFRFDSVTHPNHGQEHPSAYERSQKSLDESMVPTGHLSQISGKNLLWGRPDEDKHAFCEPPVLTDDRRVACSRGGRQLRLSQPQNERIRLTANFLCTHSVRIRLIFGNLRLSSRRRSPQRSHATCGTKRQYTCDRSIVNVTEGDKHAVGKDYRHGYAHS